MWFEYVSFSPEYKCPVIQGNRTKISLVELHPGFDLVYLADCEGFTISGLVRDVCPSFPRILGNCSDGNLNYLAYFLKIKYEFDMDGTLVNDLRKIKEFELELKKKKSKI